MRRFLQSSFFLYFAFFGIVSLLSLDEEKEEVHYLIPPQNKERSTYESLTEEKGTLKVRKEQREMREKAQKEKKS